MNVAAVAIVIVMTLSAAPIAAAEVISFAGCDNEKFDCCPIQKMPWIGFEPDDMFDCFNANTFDSGR